MQEKFCHFLKLVVQRLVLGGSPSLRMGNSVQWDHWCPLFSQFWEVQYSSTDDITEAFFQKKGRPNPDVTSSRGLAVSPVRVLVQFGQYSFGFCQDWLAFQGPVSLCSPSQQAWEAGSKVLGISIASALELRYGHVADCGVTVSLEAGRSPGESCSSRAWWSFSLVCSFGKCRFAINLAKNLSSVP